MPFPLPPASGVTLDDLRQAVRAIPRCRKCRAPVERYDHENWSSQCQFHNDEDDALRREYREDADRADREDAAEREDE